MRVGVRVHPVDHPAFAGDVVTIAGRAAERLSHLMIPKVESVADVLQAVAALDAADAGALPLHVLIESPLAVHNAFDIAAHPRVQSLSFGLMDFVSAHAGAIPAEGMGAAGQFSHPLVVRAKLAIASAAHACGKVPSHCVVTEFNDTDAMRTRPARRPPNSATRACGASTPTRSAPSSRPSRPTKAQIQMATNILVKAAAADWAPTQIDGTLHDRASYRHFWQVLDARPRNRAPLPSEAKAWFAFAAS
jgi:citrate lyase subunit beta/citryl-CoA lyase